MIFDRELGPFDRSDFYLEHHLRFTPMQLAAYDLFGEQQGDLAFPAWARPFWRDDYPGTAQLAEYGGLGNVLEIQTQNSTSKSAGLSLPPFIPGQYARCELWLDDVALSAPRANVELLLGFSDSANNWATLGTSSNADGLRARMRASGGAEVTKTWPGFDQTKWNRLGIIITPTHVDFVREYDVLRIPGTFNNTMAGMVYAMTKSNASRSLYLAGLEVRYYQERP